MRGFAPTWEYFAPVITKISICNLSEYCVTLYTYGLLQKEFYMKNICVAYFMKIHTTANVLTYSSFVTLRLFFSLPIALLLSFLLFISASASVFLSLYLPFYFTNESLPVKREKIILRSVTPVESVQMLRRKIRRLHCSCRCVLM